MMKKRIVIFSVAYHPFVGGAEQFVREIIHRLGTHFDITLITARFHRDLPIVSYEGNTKIIRVGFGKSVDRYFYPWLATRVALQEPPFNLVHGIMETYAGLAMKWYKKRTGVPSILNLQSGTMTLPKYRALTPIFQRVMRSADNIHTISIFLKKHAIHLGANPERIEVIPNGVNLESFKPLPHVSRKPFHILTVARLEKVKGVDVLLHALPSIIREIPEAKLTIAGNGTQRTTLEDLAKKLDIKKHVTFLGTVSHKQLPNLFASAEVAIIPSKAEGLGISIIEAMACGTPVIASDVGGIPDIIISGVNGILVPPADSCALTKAILMLLKNPIQQTRLREAGLSTIQHFEWSCVIKKIETLYNTLAI